MMRICCVCQRVERHGVWESVGFLSGDEPVTHGYCPDCFVEVLAEIEELAGAMAVRTLTAPDWPTMRGQWG